MLPFPRNRFAKAALLTLSLLLLVGAVGYAFWDDMPFPERAVAPQLPVANAPGAPSRPGVLPAQTGLDSVLEPENPAKPDKEPVHSAMAAPRTAQPPSVDSGQPLLHSDWSIGRLTALRSQLEVKKLEVAIGEQEDRLNKFKEPAVPVQPQIVLPLPQAEGPGNAMFPAPRSRVTAVQGIDGAVSATLTTPDGTRILKVGDRYGSGRIERISGEGIWIREGKSTRLMAVEE